jgi:tRNA A37 threonylcarbamoyladenosine dehydratase
VRDAMNSPQPDPWARSRMLIGDAGVAALKDSRVAVFGVGGVGGYACEALARAGVGALDVIDGDTVAMSNLNRQIVALTSTLGRNKAEAMAQRIRDINPVCRVRAIPRFYTQDTWDDWPLDGYDAIVDAMDMVSAKVELAVRAQQAGVFIVSAMGAGNRISPAGFIAADIQDTSGCPLARVMRRELKRRGVAHLRVVYSPVPPQVTVQPPGSMVFAPGVAGLWLAHEVVAQLTRSGAPGMV